MPCERRENPDQCKPICKAKLTLLVLVLGLAWLVFGANPVLAASWEYRINPVDTPFVIDPAKTSAAVNPAANEIALPKNAPKTAAFFGEEDIPDFVVLAPSGLIHYSFDGEQLVENPVLSLDITNPLAVATAVYPDVLVCDGTKVTHYTLGRSSPALSVTGLTGVVSIGARENDIAVLAQGQLKHYVYDGSEMNELPALSITSGLTNPIDLALAQDTCDVVVLEPDQVKYFSFTGSEMVEIPALAITGLVGAKAVSSADGDIAVVAGNQVKHYSLTGSSLAYNEALSVTTGLTAPTCVALKPGSRDRIIVDGDEVKYYQWDGSELVYNANLSVTVAGLGDIGTYTPAAAAVSLIRDAGTDVNRVRVRAHLVLPEGTSVTWSVSADGGVTWVKRWRARGLNGGATVCEITGDNGNTWTAIGDASRASPTEDTAALWTVVSPGAEIVWKAELATANAAMSPKIKAPVPGDIAVVWEASNAPEPPEVTTPAQCYVTTTPTIDWIYQDADGDPQTAYQVQIRKLDDSLVLDTGKVTSAGHFFTVPTSTAPDMAGPLWSSGDYRFKIYVKVWDSNNLDSVWSSGNEFCVVGFERPRIAAITSPPGGQPAPEPLVPASHIVITPGLPAGDLPRIKAGARVSLVIDTIGPLTAAIPSFPYNGRYAAIGDLVPQSAAGSAVNRWTVDFWTDSSLEVCPAGTVVEMTWTGTSPEGNPAFLVPPYAAGVVRTDGTVLHDWIVRLKRNKE